LTYEFLLKEGIRVQVENLLGKKKEDMHRGRVGGTWIRDRENIRNETTYQF
jgi:hypothetical protein